MRWKWFFSSFIGGQKDLFFFLWLRERNNKFTQKKPPFFHSVPFERPRTGEVFLYFQIKFIECLNLWNSNKMFVELEWVLRHLHNWKNEYNDDGHFKSMRIFFYFERTKNLKCPAVRRRNGLQKTQESWKTDNSNLNYTNCTTLCIKQTIVLELYLIRVHSTLYSTSIDDRRKKPPCARPFHRQLLLHLQFNLRHAGHDVVTLLGWHWVPEGSNWTVQNIQP